MKEIASFLSFNIRHYFFCSSIVKCFIFVIVKDFMIVKNVKIDKFEEVV